ncbi:MAG: flagellar motor switch protein FliM [Kiritimatiellia bacterium]|jgi:flagellar motor switch protein FliM
MAENPLLGRFDQQTLPPLRDLLTSASRRMRTLLINRLGFDVPVRVGAMEFGQFSAIKAHIRESGICLIARYRLVPSGIPCMITLEAPLLFRLFGLLLGEDPWAEPTPIQDRPLTDADKRMAKRLVTDLLDALEVVLPPEANQRIVLEEISVNPRIHLDVPPSTGMIDSALDFGDPDDPMGTAHFIMPTHVVPALWTRPARPLKDNSEGIARVMPLHVELVAELARISMPLTQLNNLDVGSTLEFGQVRNIEIRVADQITLIAQPGSRDGSRCIRVIRKLQGHAGVP